MSYIRGALPFLIYNPHTRDDIVPDGVSSTFQLSQEVPGGYEANVQVIRREFKSEGLIDASTAISFDGSASKIVCNDAAVAAALSACNAGDQISVSGASNSGNNGDFLISSVFYNGSTIEISVLDTLTTETGSTITLTRKFVGPWEVIEPEIDYTISGTGAQENRLINFAKIPQEQDVIFVYHRGEATYNFVPTEKSVGPDQLQDNLKNFVLDIFTGDGSTAAFTLSQLAVSPRAIEVSVNGTLKYGTDTNLAFTGDFDLSNDGLTITFATAPANGAKIHVRHLGFTTVSRRQSLSPSQIGSIAPGAVDTLELANNAVTGAKLADGSVSSSKLQSASVDGTKILLQNGEYLNWRGGLAPNTVIGVLKLDNNNLTTLRSAGGTLSLNIADTKLIQFSLTSIIDASASGQVDLGALANKFKDAYLSGTLNAASASISGDATVGGNASVTGNLTVSGNISVSGTIDSVDIVALQNQINALAALVAQNSPAGHIKIWANNTSIPAGFLLCDGSVYSQTTYPALYAAIQDAFAIGGEGAGNFRVPDLRGRFPLGKAASGTGSGWGATAGQGGSLDHTHTTPNHTHGLANHVHVIPGHYHLMLPGNSTLNITSSGNHFTALDHNHGTLTTGSGTPHHHSLSGLSLSSATTGITASSSTVNITASDSGHNHTILDNGHRHQIAGVGTTTKGDGRNTGNSSSGNPEDGNTSRFAKGASDSLLSGTGLTNGVSFSSTTGISLLPSAANITVTNGNHNHTITITDGGHTHTINIGANPISDESLHTHSLAIPNFLGNSASNGVHTHPASSISGGIGNVNTGADGSSDFTSGPPSPNLTDLGGAGVTSGANPAFQTVNYIIKT